MSVIYYQYIESLVVNKRKYVIQLKNCVLLCLICIFLINIKIKIKVTVIVIHNSYMPCIDVNYLYV